MCNTPSFCFWHLIVVSIQWRGESYLPCSTLWSFKVLIIPLGQYVVHTMTIRLLHFFTNTRRFLWNGDFWFCLLVFQNTQIHIFALSMSRFFCVTLLSRDIFKKSLPVNCFDWIPISWSRVTPVAYSLYSICF